MADAAPAHAAADPFHALVPTPPPVITSVAPDTLLPGDTAVVTGSGFAASAAGNTVLVGGVRMAVVSASPTRLTIRLPRAGFECRAPRLVTVSARVGGALGSVQHPLRTARQVHLQVGEVATGEECVELPHVGGNYIVTVVNALPDGRKRGFRLNGALGTSSGGVVTPLARDTGLVRGPTEELTEEEAAAFQAADSIGEIGQEHMNHLERERERMRRPAAPRPRTLALRGVPAPAKHVPTVGDVEFMRMRKVWDRCDLVDTVSARVVFVGEHSIIMEDASAPLAGQMNSAYDSIGREFEERMWPVITTHFGDPTALNASLDGDGRVRMLFSHRVSDLQPGVYGFITACDFEAPVGEYASSNLGEVFYARVPATQADRSRWMRETLATVVHEVKHLAAYAERRAQQAEFEHPWLEEATAMVAEELYARAYAPLAQRGNEKYEKLRCEWADTDPACTGPLSLGLHFAWLHGYLLRPDSSSVLDNGYGAGWSFVRWAADLSTQSEAEFFSDLVREASQDPGGNLAQRLNRTFPEMIVEWLVASALDDHPDVSAPARVEYSLQGWNTRDIFQALHGLGKAPYNVRPFPIKPDTEQFGRFQITRRDLPSATGYFLALGGVQQASQLLWLTDASGRPLAAGAGLRLAIARTR